METFTNTATGETIRGFFRLSEDKDAPELVACIRAEYADTYFKKRFYDTGYLITQQHSGHIIFLVLELENGVVAGMMALKSFFPQETQCEIASQIFKQEYRGFHITRSFFEYGIKIIRQKNYSAMYALPVTFHRISQILLEDLGLIPCGFLLGTFLMKNITHSYGKDDCIKHSMGIMVRAQDKQDAGKLYVPSGVRTYIENTYRKLGVTYQMAEDAPDTALNLLKESRITVVNDAYQCNCTITIDAASLETGKFMTEIRAIMERYRFISNQTMNALVNMKDAAAPYAYHILERLGFFYTGVKPLCSEREYLCMHHPVEVPLGFHHYILSDSFAEILHDISEECNQWKE